MDRIEEVCKQAAEKILSLPNTAQDWNACVGSTAEIIRAAVAEIQREERCLHGVEFNCHCGTCYANSYRTNQRERDVLADQRDTQPDMPKAIKEGE